MADVPELPEGPVTVMFTDIEASTALRTSVGDTKADDLFRAHDELIRGLIEAHRGVDLKAALGDGFLAVFVSTRRAITCAVSIQQELDQFNRDRPGAPLKVRIGLNTGEVAWQNGQPSGEAVHAAARVCAAASGGEVFVSDVTRQLAGTMPDIALTDRGDFDLKGFPQPWKLWSLGWRSTVPDMALDAFVGREAEMGELRKHLRAALDGRGSLVLVGGEPGVGKTTLVKQLIKEAQQQGAVALFGRCYESEGTVPYSPFVETTEQVLGLVPPEWVREDLGDSAAEVARMVPALRQSFPDIPEPLDLPPEQQRRYFFNAITDFITRGAARLPVVLVVDDVHWADEPTLLLVEHVAAHFPTMRLLALGTYRDVELDVSRPLAASLERLLRGRLADRISVKRFDKDGVAVMLEARIGRPPPHALVDAIFSETEGNPFFVDEVFRHLVEEGKVFDENGDLRSEVEVGELDVPESVRLVVGRRIERLGPDAQRVLAAGAVVGRGFEFSLLERLTDVDPATLLDVIDEAERARVIIPEDRGGQIYYTFGHELIRQTLLASLSLPRRQRIHLAVADGIEALDPRALSTRPSEISHHLLEAGAAADRERTITALRDTADRALEAAAFEEARRAAEAALTYLDEGEDELKLDLLERLGSAQRGLGHFDSCIEVWSEVMAACGALGQGARAGKLSYQIGYLLLWLGEFEKAFVNYTLGLELVGDDEPIVRASLLRGAATMVGLAGFFDDAEARFAEALAIAEELGDEQCLGQINWGRCVSLWSQGRIPPAIEAGEAGVALLRKAGDIWTLVDALNWLSYPVSLGGDGEAGRALAAESLELAVRIGHQAGEALAHRGLFLAETPLRPSVAEWTSRGEDDLRRLKAFNSPWVSQSQAWLSVAKTLAGDLDEGLAYADAAIAVEPVSAWSGIGWGFRFLNRAAAGDAAECRAMLDEHLAALPKTAESGSLGSIFALSVVCESCALLGEVDRLAELYPIAVDILGAMPVRPFDFALSHRVAGMVAAGLERWDDAEKHFEAAFEQIDSWPNRFDAPIVCHRYAEMLVRRGRDSDVDRARELVAQAIDGYREIGIAVYLPAAEELAKSLG